jgi:hypothetical protein
MIRCPNVTFVTVGFDYPMEAFISKNIFELIINNPNLKEWIVDYTFINGNYPKLRRIITERGILLNCTNDYVQCNSILEVGDVISQCKIPVIRFPKEYTDNFKYLNFISPPGYLKYYYSSPDDPVVRESEMVFPNFELKNSKESLHIEGVQNMSKEQAEQIMIHIKQHTDKLSIRFRSQPWNSEIYYITILDKDKMVNE